MNLEELISQEYRQEQVILHARPNGYGGKGDKWAPAVMGFILGRHCRSVLDYGCGEGSLVNCLRAFVSEDTDLREYDPAIPGKDSLPEPADLVVCTDVLEHIEPGKLSAVFEHLNALALKALFLVIATRPSGKTLSDGRNAHLILESKEWWGERLRQAGFKWIPGPASPSKKPSREFVAVVIKR